MPSGGPFSRRSSIRFEQSVPRSAWIACCARRPAGVSCFPVPPQSKHRVPYLAQYEYWPEPRHRLHGLVSYEACADRVLCVRCAGIASSAGTPIPEADCGDLHCSRCRQPLRAVKRRGDRGAGWGCSRRRSSAGPDRHHPAGDRLAGGRPTDWSEVDPSILGTLFERGLDPDKRAQFGAHYTDRAKIMARTRRRDSALPASG